MEEIGRNASGVRGDASIVGDLERLYAQIRDDKGSLIFSSRMRGLPSTLPSETSPRSCTTRFSTSTSTSRGAVYGTESTSADARRCIDHSQCVSGRQQRPASNSVYSAKKASIRSFARTWTTDLKDRRIRVNAISAGTIDTPGLNELLASGEAGEQRRKMIASAIPLGRFGRPDEVAKAVVFSRIG
jgi:NAD(P)-dependent dehydrogenase (short-subunit alcohol dehydrogenase family)